MTRPPKLLRPDLAAPVPPAWQTRGVWLAEAPIKLAEPSSDAVLRGLQDAAARFAELRDGETPEAFDIFAKRAISDREALLSAEERDALKRYRGCLSALKSTLFSRLQQGHLCAFGHPHFPHEPPIWIPPPAWLDLDVQPERRNFVSGNAGKFWLVRVVDLNAEGAQAAPADRLNPRKPTQSDVDAWMQTFYRDAHAEGKAQPKRDAEAFPQCREATGATDQQMRLAMSRVPPDHKRRRGNRVL